MGYGLNGLDDADEGMGTQVENVPAIEQKMIRKAFHFWDVNGVSHKLKLQTSMIAKLENKYRRNLLNIISDDGIPPLSVMLTIVQAALTPWEHGVTYASVEKLYEIWLAENGGSQPEFLNKVIVPTMAVSGFFTPDQADSIMSSLEEAVDLI